ncbi:MAG: beta galactosidase jelly roll domain-containing protein [Cyclobacteriaceae bacterium]
MRQVISIFFIFTLTSLLAGNNLKKVVDLNDYWKFSIGDNPRWSQPDFNDYKWDEIYVPSTWEEQGFNGFDGYAWYRISVDLQNISTENLYLILGYIDDVDEVYVNGQLIGFTGGFPPNFYTAYQSFRQYLIPHHLLNPNGKNVIAVRVYDTIREGGIVKGDIGLYRQMENSGSQLKLEGLWKFKEGDDWSWKANDLNDENWLKIMVPSFWENQKHLNVESNIAWYRKEFELPNDLKNEDELVLIMGLIDDFDKTYINGQLVGYTNDGKSLGVSSSWEQYRIYVIPKSIINKNGMNTIAVRVRDIGVNAGIYAGPLAIAPLKSYNKVINP